MDAVSPIRTAGALIDALGSNRALMEVFGVTSAAVSNWRGANAFPDRVKYRLAQLVAERRLTVDPALFERTPEQKGAA